MENLWFESFPVVMFAIPSMKVEMKIVFDAPVKISASYTIKNTEANEPKLEHMRETESL